MGRIRINSGAKELHDSIVDADHEHARTRMKEPTEKEIEEFKKSINTLEKKPENTLDTKGVETIHKHPSGIKDFFQIAGYILFLIVVNIPFLIIANTLEYIHSKKESRLFRFVPPFIGPAYMVDTIGSLKIIIYTNDHPPPHFHVITDKYNAKFDIENCNLIGFKGSFVNRHSKQIQSWHSSNIDLLKATWDKTRPEFM